MFRYNNGEKEIIPDSNMENNKKIQFIFSVKTCVFILFLSACIFFFAPIAKAADPQDKLTLTISPPLIKINMQPGESWSSSVKLVNNNTEQIKVYAQVLDFKSKDEGGVEFIHRKEGDEGQNAFSLSKQIKVSQEAFLVDPQKTADAPFSIILPPDFEPGGHYAAIVVSTEPESKIEGSGISISSGLTTLVMLKVKGEIREEARILRFKASKNIYQEPKADLELKIENLGNVHIQPTGEIRIYDMWNNDAGFITINKSSEFGNILPQSSRKWEYGWEGKKGITHMGRYKAIMVVSYGEEKPKTEPRVAYFWVLNYKTLGTVFGSLLLFVLFMILSVRFYIRRTIAKAQKEVNMLFGQKPEVSGEDKHKQAEESKPKGADRASLGDVHGDDFPAGYNGRFDFENI